MRFARIAIFSLALGMALSFHAPAWAQSRQANITGSSGTGKCTFEVTLTGNNAVAEVEISNNRGFLKTVSGQRPQWRRLVCNQPLPRNPNNFRFRGIDGHGKQYLVGDPNSNGGTAVVRIENNRNGNEGYTGDILWDGGGNSGGGNWNNGGGNNNNDWGNNNNNGNWGNNNSGSWTVQNAQYGTSNRNRNVTTNVRRLANGPNFRVTNDNMGGDPAVGADKTLRITARAPNGTVRTFNYSEGSMVDTQMFSGGGGGGWGGNNNNWNQNTVRNNCQNAIRNQLVGQYGGTLNFNGNPSQQAAGGSVRVRGTGRFKDRNGKQGNIEYNCVVNMNGNVQDARYQVIN